MMIGSAFYPLGDAIGQVSAPQALERGEAIAQARLAALDKTIEAARRELAAKKRKAGIR